MKVCGVWCLLALALLAIFFLTMISVCFALFDVAGYCSDTGS